MRNARQRRERIIELLLEQGSVQVAALVSLMGVSAVTIRTDLAAIEAQGLATRSHGGAALVRTPPPEQNIRQKSDINSGLKESIGAAAACLVLAGENVIIDSGTTTLSLAQHLHASKDITVMTNGLNIAWELADTPGIELLITGGVLRRQSLSFQGRQAASCLNAYNFDKLFLGVDGCDLQFGLTTHDEAEASLNHKMVERARKIIVLADSSKFGRVSLHRIDSLDRVHTIITDAGIGDEYRDGIRQLGIELIIAE